MKGGLREARSPDDRHRKTQLDVRRVEAATMGISLTVQLAQAMVLKSGQPAVEPPSVLVMTITKT